MYYRCTRDLWSIIFDNLMKFSKDGIYVSVAKDIYINNQGREDDVSVEGWQEYFIPIDLEAVNINEAHEILAL